MGNESLLRAVECDRDTGHPVVRPHDRKRFETCIKNHTWQQNGTAPCQRQCRPSSPLQPFQFFPIVNDHDQEFCWEESIDA